MRQIVEWGENIEEYFYNKNELQKKQSYIIGKIEQNMKDKFNKDSDGNDKNHETDLRKIIINPEIRKILTKNPLKIRGMGLPEEFHEIFKMISERKRKKQEYERIWKNPKNH